MVEQKSVTTARIRNIYVTYNDIALRLDALANEIRHSHFEAVVMILRGGTFAGMHLSFLTGLPYYFLRYDRIKSLPHWVGDAPKMKRILLCEDFAGKGRTLIDCKNFLMNHGYDISTLVVCKDHMSALSPDYYCFDNQKADYRFLLPWERYRINPQTDAEAKDDRRADHEFERTAWDLDGIFLDDIDEEMYQNDLQQTLALRDEYPISALAPLPSLQDVVITGRPLSDRERTEKWLRKHGISIPVVLRDDGEKQPSKESVARWKGERALEIGCTHFVESDPIQALHLAALYPELRVIWWNQGQPVSLNATKSFALKETSQ